MTQLHVAFLRAVNVSGRYVKMPLLREVFEQMGFVDVSTFIASGNVIFGANSADGERLERLIEQALREALGFEVPTFVRRGGQVAEAARRGLEFEEELVGPQGQVLVGFLDKAPDEAARARLIELADDINAFRFEGRELYWALGGRISESPISGSHIEKRLGMLTTTRNVRTLRRLAEKLGLV